MDSNTIRSQVAELQRKQAADEKTIAKLEQQVGELHDLVKRGKWSFYTLAALGAIITGVVTLWTQLRGLGAP